MTTTANSADAQGRRGTGHVFAAIATPSHLAAARVALDSLRPYAATPGRFLFTVGQAAGVSVPLENVTQVAVEDVMDARVLEALAARYTAAELSCALKPLVLRWLAQQGFSYLHYIDADVKFYSDPAPLRLGLEQADVVLTPHCLQPFPQDGRRPRELALVRGGVFNAGYVGVSANAPGMRFLDWWAQRLARHGFQDPARGMSGDQRWLDLVPALFPGLSILRHPGANVGYWNLQERALEDGEAGPRCAREPLLFFHFSGFDPARPHALSVYQDRFDTSAMPTISRLMHGYAQELAAHQRRLPAPSRYPHWRWWHGTGWLATRYRRHRTARLSR
jgi:hypothetical protein